MKVTVRRAIGDDAEVLHAIRQQPEVRRHQPLKEITRTHLRRQLNQRAAHEITPGFAGKAVWAIDADGLTIGWISLAVTDRDHDIGAVGYSVSALHHGKGIGRLAVREAIMLAFAPNRMALERLEAVVAVSNRASQRVLELNGFRREGIARGLLRIGGERVDHVRFGLLHTDHRSALLHTDHRSALPSST